MHGYFLGPMTPRKFMSSFMPINSNDPRKAPDGIDFRQVYDQASEQAMYEPFVLIANTVCTNFVAVYTGDRVNHETVLKPDITFFAKNNMPELCDTSKNISANLHGDTNFVTSFVHMELFVELKLEALSDPFRDLRDEKMEERDSNQGNNTRGQFLLYAANQLAYQHRLFAFGLVICGKIARFIRWDREGVVVSAAIDCSTDQNLVVEFLFRFNQLTPEKRGLDPTATLATPEQTELFESEVAKIETESLKRTIGPREDFPRFKLEVRDPNGTVFHYIVGKAMDYNLGIVGRCTRGYLALDLCTRKCVFLKDMWRPDVPGVQPEHFWYGKLMKAKVPHLVKFKHASDVIPSTPPRHYYGTAVLSNPVVTTGQQGAQRGLTSRLGHLFKMPNPPSQAHIHYRLVQEELCQPLSEFTNSEHLTLVVLHSLEACSSAHSDADVFHRDASVGNVMIGPEGGGRLNDWDLCRDVKVDKSLEGPRTGTWQFMSTRLLTNPGSRHTIADDLESHYFVLMWTALHWVEHNQPDDPCIDMENIFDQQRPLPGRGGLVKGGAGKVEMYESRDAELRGVEFTCKPFNELFWDLWSLFAEYLAQRREAARKRRPGPEPSVSPQEVINLFKAALEKPGWINDKVVDQFPRTANRGTSGVRLSNNGPNRDNANQGKKRGLTQSLGVDLEELPAKRQRATDRSGD